MAIGTDDSELLSSTRSLTGNDAHATADAAAAMHASASANARAAPHTHSTINASACRVGFVVCGGDGSLRAARANVATVLVAVRGAAVGCDVGYARVKQDGKLS